MQKKGFQTPLKHKNNQQKSTPSSSFKNQLSTQQTQINTSHKPTPLRTQTKISHSSIHNKDPNQKRYVVRLFSEQKQIRPPNQQQKVQICQDHSKNKNSQNIDVHQYLFNKNRKINSTPQNLLESNGNISPCSNKQVDFSDYVKKSCKKGIKLSKNLNQSVNQKQNTIKQANQGIVVQLTIPIQIQALNKFQSPQNSKSQFCKIRQTKVCYTSHFFRCIYKQHVRQNRVTLYQFSLILKCQKLINDIVSQRHSVNRIWSQINQLLSEQRSVFLNVSNVFSFLIAILGYRCEDQLLIFKKVLYQKSQTKLTDQQIQQMFKIYHHYYKIRHLYSLNRLANNHKPICKKQRMQIFLK